MCVWLFYCHVINASKHQWFKITTILLMNLWVRNLGGTWQQIRLLLPMESFTQLISTGAGQAWKVWKAFIHILFASFLALQCSTTWSVGLSLSLSLWSLGFLTVWWVQSRWTSTQKLASQRGKKSRSFRSLKVQPWKPQSIISAPFYWSKPVTRAAWFRQGGNRWDERTRKQLWPCFHPWSGANKDNN